MDEPRWKILQFVKSSDRYGASVSIRNLSQELKNQGHEVSLAVFSGHNLGASMAKSGFRIVDIPAFGKFNLAGILRLRKRFLEEKPDVVHTHLSAATLTGSWAARLAHIPVVSTVHGMNKKWTYMFADHLIAVSQAGKDNLVNQGIRPDKVSVAYNGIPMPPTALLEKRKSIRAELGADDDSLVLATISRADFGKGIQDGIDAITMLRRNFPAIQYWVVGEGEYLEELRQQTAALGLGSRVKFLGFREDVFDILSGADLFLFPSLKEAMGISIVEAMAMNLPVVGTRVGGIPEVVIENETGVLASPSDAGSLAAACAPLLESLQLRQAMGVAGRRRAEDVFSLRASAVSVLDVYRKLIGK
jgi:glycosyltransferase involved in cell wall biosynthesis